jgi:hypothetical protein
MEFDHVGPKAHAVSAMVDMKASRKRILEEVARTELVCILCHRTRTFARRLANRTVVKPKKPRELMNWALVARYRSQPCSVCGKRRPWYQMDLHHRNPSDKQLNLASYKGFQTKLVQAELLKCQPVCALCHRRKTGASTYPEFLESPKGAYRPNVRITSDVVSRILALKQEGQRQKDISRITGASKAVVSQVVRGIYKNTKLRSPSGV